MSAKIVVHRKVGKYPAYVVEIWKGRAIAYKERFLDRDHRDSRMAAINHAQELGAKMKITNMDLPELPGGLFSMPTMGSEEQVRESKPSRKGTRG
ncbi:hypothetical protein [Ferrimonas balearica]|uniref:hypothetical protein n=1 Tax=Ferrimonas balearica TaxID=44012 RepID=UPI001F278136|nr:hypothetical protein [Ferrimonas balearica]MBY6093827.1 hypothetical protein [Ferrimonas balearica]